MTITIDVRLKTGHVIDRIKRIRRNVPKQMGNAGYDYVKAAQRQVRFMHTKTSKSWRRSIWNSIQARRLSKNRSVLVIGQKGIFLDSMRPHWVALKRGRLINRWARDRGLTQAAIAQKSIFVRPHPFIDAGLRRARHKLKPILQRRLKKGVTQ